MKIKLDENLPGQLVAALTTLGHDVDTVVQERLAGVTDDAVWHAAQQAGRFLITQDLDFSDLRRFVPGTPSRAPEVSWQNCLVQSDPIPVRRRGRVAVDGMSAHCHRAQTSHTPPRESVEGR